jgi:hypothetical protein
MVELRPATNVWPGDTEKVPSKARFSLSLISRRQRSSENVVF